MAPTEINSLDALEPKYQGFLFDAYGVLLDGSGLITPAAKAWHQLRKRGKSCWILTNGSARTPAEATVAYQALGLDVQYEEVITSGFLLHRHFQVQGLLGKKVCVLGTPSTAAMVAGAGGHPVGALQNEDFEVLVVANQTEYPFLESLDAVLTQICRRVEAGRDCQLILTNPDLIYPKSGQTYGFTAGAVALLLEAGLNLRLGAHAPVFTKLGKPFAPIFAEAERRAGHKKLLMIGDQLETDILGAANYGLDSVLVGTGLTRPDHRPIAAAQPTYILRSWELA